MADLLLNWVGFNQTSKSIANVHVAMQVNRKLTNWDQPNSDSSFYELFLKKMGHTRPLLSIFVFSIHS